MSRMWRMNLSVRFPNTKHAKHVLARAIACCLLQVLPSCQIPKLRQAEPAPGLPADFNVPTSAAATGAANGAAIGTAIGATSGGSIGAAIGAASGGAIGAVVGV